MQMNTIIREEEDEDDEYPFVQVKQRSQSERYDSGIIINHFGSDGGMSPESKPNKVCLSKKLQKIEPSQADIDDDDDSEIVDDIFSPVRSRCSSATQQRGTFSQAALDLVSNAGYINRNSERFDRILNCGVIPKRSSNSLENAHETDINCIAISPDGTMLATGGADCIVKLWDTRSLYEIPSMRIPKKSKKKGESEFSYFKFTKPVSALAFSYCNDYLAAASCDLSIKIWKIDRISSTVHKALTGHTDVIHSCKFLIGTSFIEPLLVTGSEDRTVKFWEYDGTTFSLSCTSACLCMDALMLDGILATGHLDGSVRVWSGRQKSLIYRFAPLHEDAVTSLCINPITFTITSVGKDHSIKLVDYKEKLVLDCIWPDSYVNIQHSAQSITCGAYSQSIIVASGNNKLLLYKLERNKQAKKKRPTKLQTRSKSMSSYLDLSNSISEVELKLKEVKIIDVEEQMKNRFAIDYFGFDDGDKKPDIITAVLANPCDDTFVTAHRSGKICNYD